MCVCGTPSGRYLAEAMGDALVSVNVTPNGLGDALLKTRGYRVVKVDQHGEVTHAFEDDSGDDEDEEDRLERRFNRIMMKEKKEKQQKESFEPESESERDKIAESGKKSGESVSDINPPPPPPPPLPPPLSHPPPSSASSPSSPPPRRPEEVFIIPEVRRMRFRDFAEMLEDGGDVTSS